MNVKILTTSVATAALVGAIGLVYAQSSTDPARPATDSTMQVPTDPTVSPAPTPAAPSTAPSPGGEATAEPTPRADRG